MYYHITTKENAEKILKEGLIPTIGPNSQLCEENEAAIYLCNKKDIPYWQILLQKFTILEIDEEAIDLNNCFHFKYSLYSEYIITHKIEPQYIKRVNLLFKREKENEKLCLNYIHGLSRYCEVCARWYDLEDERKIAHDDWFTEIKISSKLFEKVLKNLDYSKVDKKKVREVIKEMGDNCSYTLCDWFYDEKKRLYQKLIEYPKDDFTESREFVYKYIKSNLKGCLSVETGGWCGC